MRASVDQSQRKVRPVHYEIGVNKLLNYRDTRRAGVRSSPVQAPYPIFYCAVFERYHKLATNVKRCYLIFKTLF